MMEESIGVSPSRSKEKNGEPEKLTFPQAMEKIIQGFKVHKLEWKNKEWYACKEGGWLKIHKPPLGTVHQWLVSDGDLLGEDYVVI